MFMDVLLIGRWTMGTLCQVCSPGCLPTLGKITLVWLFLGSTALDSCRTASIGVTAMQGLVYITLPVVPCDIAFGYPFH